MPWDSTHRANLLKAAIVLFGDRGYEGVTARDLAAKAGCATGSIYRLYGSKEILYVRALEDIATRAEADLGKIVVGLYAEQKNHDVRDFIAEATTRWYLSLSQSAARFIQQVFIGDPKRHELALAVIAKPITILVAILQEKSSSRAGAGARNDVETLVWRLFQYKVSRPSSLPAKEETDKVRGVITNWLELVMSKR